MVVGTVPLVQKGYPHRELNPCRELNPYREYRYMIVRGTHTIPCMGDLSPLRALSPPPCTYILCISLHWSPLLLLPTFLVFSVFTAFPCTPCVSLHSLHFPGWFPMWVPTTPMLLHSLYGSLCGLNSLHQ